MAKETTSSTPGRWYTAGKKLLKLGRYADALRFFNQTLDAHPANELASHTWTNIAQCQHELERDDEALQALDQALELNAQHAGAWRLRAEILAQQRRYHDALEAANHAVTVAPADANAWALQGRIFQLIGQDDDALDADEQALRLDPDYVWAWQGQIDVLADRGQSDEAIAACDRALQVQSITAREQAHILSSKAHLVYQLHRHEEALTAARAASRLDGATAHTWELMGGTWGCYIAMKRR